MRGYYTLTVTEEDIKNGQRGDCYLCPIARALTRVTGKEFGINYSYLFLREASKPWERQIEVPYLLRMALAAYDAGGPPPIGPWELKVPPWFTRLMKPPKRVKS